LDSFINNNWLYSLTKRGEIFKMAKKRMKKMAKKRKSSRKKAKKRKRR